MRLMTMMMTLSVAAAFQLPLLHTPRSAGIAVSPRPVAMRFGFRKIRKENDSAEPISKPDVAVTEETAVPATAGKAFDSIDVSGVVEHLVDGIVEPPETKAEHVKAAIQVDMEVIEDTAVSAFKAGKWAVDALIAGWREHEIGDKTQNVVKGLAQFNEDNDVLIKARAVLELGVEEAGQQVRQMQAKPKATPGLMSRMQKPKQKTRATTAKKVAPKMAKKKASKMPKKK